MGTTYFLRATLSLPRDQHDVWLSTALDAIAGPFEGWMEHEEDALSTGTVAELLALLDEASDHFTYAADDTIELRALFSGDFLVDHTAALARSLVAAAHAGASGSVLLADAGTRRGSVLTLKGTKTKLGAPRANVVTPAELAETAHAPRTPAPSKRKTPRKAPATTRRRR